MIIDNLKNISNYNFISQNVIDFLTGLNSQTETGHYEIDEHSYANVDIYEALSQQMVDF